MTFGGLVVVVPTRNRGDFVRRAVSSVADQLTDGARLLVSDNSTTAETRHEVEQFCAGRAGAEYMRPSEPLPMAEHWEWALDEACRRAPGATHVTYMTDRTVMRPGALTLLLAELRRDPGFVLAYNQDMVDDWTTPVELHQYEWTGYVFEVDSAHVLRLSSRAVLPPFIPRMLNSAVPVEVLDAVRARFGTVFRSVAPDFAFAYRSLTLVDKFRYMDRSVLVHYGLSRSNGASYARGIDSADSADFLEHVSEGMNALAPAPELRTSTNPVYHEYNLVRDQSGSDRMPPIDEERYYPALAADIAQIEQPEVRARMEDLLARRGWSRQRVRRAHVRLTVENALAHAHHPLQLTQRVTQQALLHPRGRRAARAAAKAGVAFPVGIITTFPDTEAALAHAVGSPRRPAREPRHLRTYFSPAGVVRRVR